LPILPDIDIEMIDAGMSEDELAAIKKEMELAEQEMKRAGKEMKKAEQEMKRVDKEMKQRRMEIEVEDNGVERKVIFMGPEGNIREQEALPLLWSEKTPGTPLPEGCRIIKISCDSTFENRMIIIERDDLVGNGNALPRKKIMVKRSENNAPVSEPEKAKPTDTATSPNERAFELSVKDFKVFPNPSSGKISMEGTFESNEPVFIRILDGRGTLVHEETIHPATGFTQHEFNLETVARGTYLLQLRQGEKWLHQKVILR
jgi:hypothetical protein